MISRSRSGPTVAAMSIECTTSANSTVTCLYSADRLTSVTGAPHSLQNLEFGGSSVPHDPHGSPAAVSAPRPLSSTSVSCHRWSTMSVISQCHLRHEVLRPSYVVSFETRPRNPQGLVHRERRMTPAGDLVPAQEEGAGLVDLVECVGRHGRVGHVFRRCGPRIRRPGHRERRAGG